MNRLDLHLHLSLTFCHKYAVCQISYARKERKHQQALPQLLHGATAPRAKASWPRAGRVADTKPHKWFELKEWEGGYK